MAEADRPGASPRALSIAAADSLLFPSSLNSPLPNYLP